MKFLDSTLFWTQNALEIGVWLWCWPNLFFFKVVVAVLESYFVSNIETICISSVPPPPSPVHHNSWLALAAFHFKYWLQISINIRVINCWTKYKLLWQMWHNFCVGVKFKESPDETPLVTLLTTTSTISTKILSPVDIINYNTATAATTTITTTTTTVTTTS